MGQEDLRVASAYRLAEFIRKTWSDDADDDGRIGWDRRGDETFEQVAQRQGETRCIDPSKKGLTKASLSPRVPFTACEKSAERSRFAAGQSPESCRFGHREREHVGNTGSNDAATSTAS
jgi:hypothetical protein